MTGGLQDPELAREQARRILAQPRFHESRPPRPLRPVLDAIGRAVEWAVRPLGRPLRWVSEHVPGGPRVFWGALAVAALVGVAFVVRSLARRRDRRTLGGEGPARRSSASETPAALERAAAAAAAAGDLEQALRLRFRAGVLRLQLARVVPRGGVLTSRELSRRLRSPAFDDAARIFDEVVYGRRPARPVDVETSVEDWHQVLRVAQAPS